MERWANDIATTLAAGVTAEATKIKVSSFAGFPTGAQYRVRVENEIMIVTAGAGAEEWTVERGAEGTAAAAHAALTTVEHLITKGSLETLEQTALAEAKYAPQNPGIVSPLLVPQGVVSAAQAPVKETLYLVRTIIPKTGVLHDLNVWVAANSGKVMGYLYDTNDALAGSRTRLWKGAEVTPSGTSRWVPLGDPAINVTRGQQLEFGIAADNNTITFGRGLAIVSGAEPAKLPANFGVSAAGALGKFASHVAITGFAAPETIAEANLLTSGPQSFSIIGRIS